MQEESIIDLKSLLEYKAKPRLEDLIEILRQKNILTEDDVRTLEQKAQEHWEKFLAKLGWKRKKARQQKQCPICGKTFRGSQALGSHLWYMHKIKKRAD